MTLSDYLARPGITATALAEKCGVSVSSITRAAKGEISPSYELIRAICENTEGAVRPDDFFDLPPVEQAA